MDAPTMIVEEAAEYLRLNPETVRRLVREGSIPAVKVRRRYRFRREDLDDWMARGGGSYEDWIDRGLLDATLETIAGAQDEEWVPLPQLREELGS